MVPRIDTLQDGGYTREEMKMVWETRKIMGLETATISATCVRVPVERAHSEAVQISTERALELAEIRQAIEAAPGVVLKDNPLADDYPTPLFASGEDEVFVGRLRQHPDERSTYDLWIVGDQIRKGAALNTIQIGETMIERGLLGPKKAAAR